MTEREDDVNEKRNKSVKRSPRTRADHPLAVSLDEAAALAGIGRGTLYKELKSGGPKTFTIRGRRLILVTELERWLHDVAEAQSERAAA